jgi:hypothetical protein
MSTKTNLVLDLTIFTAFLAVSNPRFTGSTIHEWLSVSFAAAIITHLLFHWKWIANLTTEFFKKLIHSSRLNYVVDMLFFIAMTAAFFSGLMISKSVLATLGLQLNTLGGSWKMIHKFAADTSLIMLGIHFGLHWKWVITNVGRYIVSPVRNLFQRRSAPQTLAVQPVRIEEHK